MFETFPQPEFSDGVAAAGRALSEFRGRLMASRGEGLTKVYNQIYSPAESTADIVQLRQLHVALDDAVRTSYGWNDLAFRHGFH